MKFFNPHHHFLVSQREKEKNTPWKPIVAEYSNVEKQNNNRLNNIILLIYYHLLSPSLGPCVNLAILIGILP